MTVQGTAQPRTASIKFRATPDERRAIEAAAARAQRSISDWARRAVLAMARGTTVLPGYYNPPEEG